MVAVLLGFCKVPLEWWNSFATFFFLACSSARIFFLFHLCCMQFFSSDKGLQEIFFRNHPHPPSRVKVARSSFWVTIPLNFKQLVYHSEQPNRKSIVTADLEKDESFTWGTFHRNRSYHSNVMTSSPILHES